MPWNCSAATSEKCGWESEGSHEKYWKDAITAYTRVTYPIMWPKSKRFTASGAERAFGAESHSKFPALNWIHDRDDFSRPIRCSTRKTPSGSRPLKQKPFLACRIVLTRSLELMSAFAAINLATTSTCPFLDAKWSGDDRYWEEVKTHELTIVWLHFCQLCYVSSQWLDGKICLKFPEGRLTKAIKQQWIAIRQ